MWSVLNIIIFVNLFIIDVDTKVFKGIYLFSLRISIRVSKLCCKYSQLKINDYNIFFMLKSFI